MEDSGSEAESDNDAQPDPVDYFEEALSSLVAEEEALAETLVREELQSQSTAAESSASAGRALTSVFRHIETFAPSGIVDLSERGIRHAAASELDFEPLGNGLAATIRELDLSRNYLNTLPPNLMRPLTGLIELNLSHNELIAFPAALCRLPALRILDLSSNLLDAIGISAELFGRGLPVLEVLRLHANRLKHMPQCLAGASALIHLDLSSNRLAQNLNDPFSGAVLKLQELLLAQNGCLQVPHSLWSLPLTSLTLDGNRLAHLPKEIEHLATTLTALRLPHNELSAFD